MAGRRRIEDPASRCLLKTKVKLGLWMAGENEFECKSSGSVLEPLSAQGESVSAMNRWQINFA